MSRRPFTYCLLVLFIGVASVPLGATAQQPVTLPSQQSASLRALDTVPVERLPAVDTEALRAEDEKQQDEIGPYRYGTVQKTNITPRQRGVWERLPSGKWLWRLRIQSPDARSLSLGFTRFVLPTGARLFVHEGEGGTIRGPYTRADATNGQHWTPVVRGEESVIELVVPDGRRSSVRLTVGKVVHGYRPIRPTERTDDASKAGSCNLDVACEEADPWRDQVRSVGHYSFEDAGGAFVCTGSLVNNTAEDERPFFLTAEHCVSSPSVASTMVFYWNYQNETCRTPGTGENGRVTDDDKRDQTSSGAVLRARYGGTHESGSIAGKSDLTLVEVDDDIPQSYNLFFSGWSREGDPTEEGVTIHHPQGHGKRISFDRDSSSVTAYLESSGGDTHLRIGNWETGTTEGGSSGSPLYDTDQRIVGVLSGGFAGCVSGTAEDNDEPDWYGRIAPGFENGDYEGKTLADWLDPTNSGTLVLDGRTQQGIPRPDPPTDVTTTADPDSVTIDWTGSDSTNVMQYHIYRATAPIDSTTGPPDATVYDSVSAEHTQYTDTGVQLSTKYHYRLTAVDDSSLESSPSNESMARPGAHPVVAVQPDSIVGRTDRDSTTEQQATITNEGPSNSRLTFSVDGFAAASLLNRVPDHEHNRSARQYGHSDLSKGASDSRTGAPVALGAGGPDDFGYRWIDSNEPGGPAFQWTDIRSAGTQASLGDDDTITVETPDGFSFYGTDRSTVLIGSNGYLTFGDEGTAYSNDEIPDSASPNALVAPFWDDLNPATNGTVHYLRDTENGRLVVQWTAVSHYDNASAQNTFQVILEANGTIRYRYLEMAPQQEATIGIENDDGTDGLQVAFNTEYVTDSLAVRIATTPPLVSDVSPASGELTSGASEDVTVTLDAGERTDGVYSENLPISTNDPGSTTVNVRVELEVQGAPIPPSNLTTTIDSDSVVVDWTASTSNDVTRYRIYRATEPIGGVPSDISAVDSVDGTTTSYTDDGELGRTYYYRVTTVDEEGAEGGFSEEASVFLYPSEVTAAVERSFGDASDEGDYRLVALPGAVDRSLGEALDGEAGAEWRAYWDDGSDEDFLVRFDGSDTFRFRAGNGFWLISGQEWTSSAAFPTVELEGDTAAVVDVHEGWNIVSNPLDTDVAFAAIDAVHEEDLKPFWGFAGGSFSAPDTIASARSGRAYYFRNDQGLDALRIPYPGAPGSTGAPKSSTEEVPMLSLRAAAADSEGPSSTVQVGFSETRRALVAPPGRFEETSLRIKAETSPSGRADLLMAERRPIDGSGATFRLRLMSEVEGPVELSAENVDAVEGQSVALLHPSAGTTHDLREEPTVQVEPGDEATELRVAIGTADYVEDKVHDVLPTEVRLTSYPNPVRQQGTIEYALPEETAVTLRVYDVLGREVATVVQGRKKAGRHTARFDTDKLASGVYFGRLTAGDRTLTQKITIVR